LWNMRSSESRSGSGGGSIGGGGNRSGGGGGGGGGGVSTKSDEAPQNAPSMRQPRFGEMPTAYISKASSSSYSSRSGTRSASGSGGIGDDGTPALRLEELSSRQQFEQARQSRVSFQKMGKLFGGMVTRFLGIEDGKISYYDKRASKKRRGTYVLGPGARVKILDASKMDPESNDGLKPGTCWLRVQGLRRANGQEHTPILILTKNESEALLWKGAIEYARLLGRQSGREDMHDEEDMSEKQSEMAAGMERERRELRSFKNADDIRRERAALAKEAEQRRRVGERRWAGAAESDNSVKISGDAGFAGDDKEDASTGNGNADGSNDGEHADAAANKQEKKKKTSKREERRLAKKATKEAKKQAKRAKKAARAAAYLARKDNAMKKRKQAEDEDGEDEDEDEDEDDEEEDGGGGGGGGGKEGDFINSDDANVDMAAERNPWRKKSKRGGGAASKLITGADEDDGVRVERLEEKGDDLSLSAGSSSSSSLPTSRLPATMARMDTSRRLGKQDTAFYHRTILQITRHLQRRHHFLQAEAKAKEAEREREEGELLNEAERDRRRKHLKNLKKRNRKNRLNGAGLPADLLLPLDNDGGKQDSMTLLRRARARRSGLSRKEAAVLEMENVLISFEESMQPELDQFDDRVLARAVVHVLSLLPQPLVPPEVWSMYKRTWEYSLEEARRREVIARKGHILPEQLITRERRLEVVSELVEMLPMSNVRLLREVLGVRFVKKCCSFSFSFLMGCCFFSFRWLKC
jgi:hypothetical protein